MSYRTFESAVLPRLVAWASMSFEKSLNQPTLPHAIIVLNATDMAIDSMLWDIKNCTEKMLSDVCDAIKKVPLLQDLVQKWRDIGKTVKTTKDLLECYYSSISVVRIPTKGRYMLMHQQVGKLHHELVKRCNQSHYMKAKVRMLQNSDELQGCLQAGFDHFSHDLNVPFNFMEELLRINPIPLNFGGNIFKLAIAVKDHRPEVSPRWIFSKLSSMVASCIILDIHRHRRRGKQVL